MVKNVQTEKCITCVDCKVILAHHATILPLPAVKKFLDDKPSNYGIPCSTILLNKMTDKIRNDAQYNQVLSLIEFFIQKATSGGGFHMLRKEEADELHHLSLLAESYEDTSLKIMPLPVATNTIVF